MPKPRYAVDTSVSPEESRAEIERTLKRYEATRFGYMWDEGTAVVAFTVKGRQVKFELPLPDREDAAFKQTSSNQHGRLGDFSPAKYDQAIKQRWRALALVIKAKLEAVETGIVTFEEEFMAHIVLPDGSTVGEWMTPQIEQAYLGGKMPPLMLESKARG